SSQTTEASVYQVGDRRIAVEIPGVTDANAILEELGTPGDLYFITQTNTAGEENYSYDSSTGEYKLNKDLATLQADGSVVLTGSQVSSATSGYNTNQTTNSKDPVVSITLNQQGTQAFADATTKAYQSGESIGIYYDGHFVSVPKVNAAITDGNCIIEGMSSIDEAEKLASYIRIGGLDIKLNEIQSQIVGAQLGSDALSSSLLAGLIGLIAVILFMIIMYRLPGVNAALALVFYTALVIFIIWSFDITLTLPGIAGIILSIGMAVDANVIIFARIKEEIAVGHDANASVQAGFKKAMSAILDGNITTLIAAAVLYFIGSGTVKGFAVTLAIGVVLSMFTALVVTRILLNVCIAFDLTNPNLYGSAKKRNPINFIDKKKIFFTISALIIAAGLITMGVQAGMGNKALNYSLEFSGGTSTTVNLDKEYTLAEVDSEIVPLVSQVTGDNDIQTQLVDGSNQVIIKTRTLDLEEREALNKALLDSKGIQETDISSENISSMISSEMRTESLIAVIVAAVAMLLYIWLRFKDARYASSAIIALVHDVLVVLTLYAIFRLTVGSTFIACMLTVIGYSVNDTIVIFDRIRENDKKLTRREPEDYKKLCNESITQTLSRSISTSFTTVLMVLMLLIFGVSTIKEFAIPLLLGVVVGTYSSICLATELWYIMRVHIKGKKGPGSSRGNYKKQPKKAKNDVKAAKKANDGVMV
nr:protein translocase subunit SecD [Lachnospiraceae bacterium]